MTSNRHPVDELADVRAEMRRLKAREDELRDAILAGTCGLVGDQHEASVRATETKRVDTTALRKEFGLERLRPFLRKSVTQTVRVAEREVPDELQLVLHRYVCKLSLLTVRFACGLMRYRSA